MWARRGLLGVGSGAQHRLVILVILPRVLGQAVTARAVPWRRLTTALATPPALREVRDLLLDLAVALVVLRVIRL